MAVNHALFTSSEFPQTNFPEFFDGDLIEEVLSELNIILKDALFNEEGGMEPLDAAHDKLIVTLRIDILNSPYLYLSDSLVRRLKKA
jgi:hypothetical protein